MRARRPALPLILLAVATQTAWLLPGWCQPDEAEEAYDVSPTRVLVDRPEQWTQWEIPAGSYAIAADGSVQPLLLRRDVNAALDAHTYEYYGANRDTIVGGIWRAGTDPEGAHLVIDGDSTTCWEPSLGDDLSQWFLEIDLGRTVIADRIRVRFADAGDGDPFLKFRVMVSDGWQIYTGDADLEFYRVGQVTYPNKQDRVFEFEVKPRRPLPEGVTGEIVQVIRVEALDSDGPRGAEVTRAEYEAMPGFVRGAADYYRQTVTGRQILVDEETYLELPPEEQGDVRFWRPERPRLAEVEVITPGENIVVQTQKRILANTRAISDLVRVLTTDGYYDSHQDLRTYDAVRDKNQVVIDLGARFWLDRIRLLSPYGPPPAYQVRVADGSVDPSGALAWYAFDERLNRQLHLQVEEQFALRQVRYIEVRRLAYVGSDAERANVSEIQAYGGGYVSQVTLTSPLIKLGASRMLNQLSWNGDAPPGTRIELRTRSGDDIEYLYEYHDIYGYKLTKDQWENAREEKRGPVITHELPGPGWSKWSEVYLESGEPFKSPSPRTMTQVQIKLLADVPERRAAIRSLRLDLSPPLVDQVVAEIWPSRDVEPGVDQEFDLYVYPRFRSGDPGFDRLTVRSTSSSPMELVSLVKGTQTDLQAGRGTTLTDQVETVTAAAGGLELLFPAAVVSGRQVYRVRFRTSVFLNGTTFWAELQRQSRPGIVQRVTEGDAAPHIQSQGLVVISELVSGELIGPLQTGGGVFTPNGDGINDEIELSFPVFRLTGEHLLEVGVSDLRGRRVRDLSFGREHPSGLHSLIWDGCDDTGQRVLPGIYLVTVDLAVGDGQRASRMGLVHVAY